MLKSLKYFLTGIQAFNTTRKAFFVCEIRCYINCYMTRTNIIQKKYLTQQKCDKISFTIFSSISDSQPLQITSSTSPQSVQCALTFYLISTAPIYSWNSCYSVYMPNPTVVRCTLELKNIKTKYTIFMFLSEF